MENKRLIILISITIFVILPGCQESNQENGIKIDYQTFYSNNVTLPNALVENYPQEYVYDITGLGKALAFQLEYPSNWKAEYNMLGFGMFSVIFYPEYGELNKSITFDLMVLQPNTTINKFKPKYLTTLTDYTESEFNISDKIDVWKIIGASSPQFYSKEYQNFNQGIAQILYDNSELYLTQTFFNDSDPKNMKIFDHMILSFKK